MTLSAEDHLAILDLVARYSHAIDFGTPDEYADCFTDDGSFDARPVVDAHGRAELIAFADRVIAGGRRSLHWTSNVVAGGDDQAAWSQVYLMTASKGLDPRPGTTGVYHDRLVKEAGMWRFRHRRLIFHEAPTWRADEVADAADPAGPR
jgi:SnoaL-like domain